MTPAPTTLAEVLAVLRAHEAELRARGVTRLSVFGSTARGEAGPDSDVDLAAVVDPAARIGIVEIDRLEEWCASLLTKEVDLITEPQRWKPRLQAEIETDRVVAF